MGKLIFVTGGARSGKSRQAEALALRATPDGHAVVYLATMQPLDEELARRIELHRARRPPHWTTLEEPLRNSCNRSRRRPQSTILLDCLSLWVSNLFMGALMDPTETEPPRSQLEAATAASILRIEELLAAQAARPGSMVAVSNEVGSGIVPENALARHYRDALGLVNQRTAAAADEAYVMLSGLPLRLK